MQLVFFIFFITSTTTMQALFVTSKDLETQGGKKKEFYSSYFYEESIFPLNPSIEKNFPLEKPYVLELENISIFSNKGLLIQDNKIVLESLWRWASLHKAPKDLFPLPPAQVTEETIAVVSQEGSSNYYHWMLEILPRIHLLQLSGTYYDKIYLPATHFPFQKETLHLLGIDLANIIEADWSTHIKPKKVIFPSLCVSEVPHPWSFPFLRKLLLDDYIPSKKRNRIFLSRKNALFRKVLNEDEIIHFLKQFDFESVVLDTLSVKEQAQLFNQAEIIIGAHGAAFTNIVFSQPGTTIIELFQGQYQRCFFDLAKALKLHYHFINTYDKEQNSPLLCISDCRDTTVNIEMLEKKLTPLLRNC